MKTSYFLTVLSLTLTTLLATPSVQGAILRVKSDAIGTGTGLSWFDAYPHLQDALDAAAAGDSIWIAAGIYYPDEGVAQTNDNRSSSFTINKSIDLYGGFNGTETFLFARNPTDNITVLSGDLDQNDGSKDANGVITDPELLVGSNSFQVVTINDQTADVRLDGITITAGLGLISDPLTPKFKTGAGIDAPVFGSLELFRCRIQGNLSVYGGGLNADVGTIFATRSQFIANDATTFGGGAFCGPGSENYFDSCVFGGNSANVGGGAYISSSSSNRFVNCTFHGNFARGVEFGSGLYSAGSSNELLNCVFWNTPAVRSALDEIYDAGTNALYFANCLVRHMDLSGSGNNLDGTDPANDPLFLEELLATQSPQVWNDFRQASNSPINDVGDNSHNVLTSDILSRDRIFNSTIDLGAVEFQPRIWRVDADATGLDTGTSWANAFNDLQDALATSINGDEIWIAQGIYRPGDGSDRNATFDINQSISIYGGFNGTEVIRDDRDPANNPTVLSGDLDQNDVTNAVGVITDPANLTGDNAFTVCEVAVGATRFNTGTAIGEPVLLTGLIFTGGLGGDNGGGLYIRGGAVDTDIISCRIRGNSASYGGGISENTSKSLRVTDAVIRNNEAIFNGGGANLGASHLLTTPTRILTNVAFVDNVSGTDGGGIDSGPGLLLNDCTFSGNSAGGIGGGLHNGTEGLLLNGLTFTGNSAGSDGGALGIADDSEVSGCFFNGNSAVGVGGAIGPAKFSTAVGLVVDQSTFVSNTTAGSTSGGAIYADTMTIMRSSFAMNASARDGGAVRIGSGTNRLENCIFSGNEATSDGGAIFHRGFTTATTIDIVNCVFKGNKSNSSSGAAHLESPVCTSSFVNCSFQGNYARFGGGALTVEDGHTEIANTVIWGNDAGSVGVDSIDVDSAASVTYTHSLIQFMNPLGTGNLDGTVEANNPDFVAPTNPTNAPTTGGDLRLQPGSPVIDQGLNSANDTTLDLDDLLRFAGAAIDLGAYEFGSIAAVTFAALYPGLQPANDANGNGLSNYLDYAVGNDPTAPADPSDTTGRVLLQDNILTLPSRFGASDVFATWESSTTLSPGVWSELMEGIDYTIQSVNISGDQQITMIELLEFAPRKFFRQTFSPTP